MPAPPDPVSPAPRPDHLRQRLFADPASPLGHRRGAWPKRERGKGCPQWTHQKKGDACGSIGRRARRYTVHPSRRPGQRLLCRGVPVRIEKHGVIPTLCTSPGGARHRPGPLSRLDPAASGNALGIASSGSRYWRLILCDVSLFWLAALRRRHPSSPSLVAASSRARALPVL